MLGSEGVGFGYFTPISLRISTLFGVSPRMRIDLAVHAMVHRGLAEGEVRVDGDGTQWRPMLHVRDAAAAYLRCIEMPDDALPVAPVWNVVGENIRIRTLARTVAGELGAGVNVEFSGGPRDLRNYRLDGAAFATATGFVARCRCESPSVGDSFGTGVGGRTRPVSGP
ncbi:NAD-dependent epimerase/dehydratase family protein [Nocardia amikacinitolerans]|uniref:NAD-dependent epimerase/dehydratase family protein n=1 Tax=Nocardia amikacinitolerans TaxID=756689 RepID=UPI0036CAD1B7